MVIEQGDLIDSVLKSWAFPGIMEPVEDNGRMVVDGGVGMPIPVPSLVESCDIKVAVDIGIYLFEELEHPIERSFMMRSAIFTLIISSI